MTGLSFDVSHLLAGGLVLISFMLLYQTRIYALIHVYSAQSFVLSLSVAWQAYVQDQPHLYITATIAFLFKAVIIPIALHRIIARLGIARDVENVVGIGPTMLAGLALVALSVVLMLRIASDSDALAREDLAFALSVLLLGLLMMVVRRNAVSMVVGFMSLENGLILAAAGAKGMPLVVEVSVGFSVLVALTVIGVFLIGLNDRFSTVDAAALDRFQGDRR
jgi:hydrogenase-4 component E